MNKNCLACDILQGRRELPGGFIHQTESWSLESCVGPFPVGTLLLKPVRHVLNFSHLTEGESAEFGPLLRRVTEAVLKETGCDQTYVCQWSHAGWEPVHIHFVIQPVWKSQKDISAKPDPFLQARMLGAQEFPDAEKTAEFAEKIRDKYFPGNESPLVVRR